MVLRRSAHERSAEHEEKNPDIAFPWYDSFWLRSFELAKAHIRQHCPGKLAEFVGAMDVLRTDPDFRTTKLDALFSEESRTEMRHLIEELAVVETEDHELFSFGRLIIHNNEFFNSLHASIVDAVSDAVGEQVEASYNFLCLYNNLGVCDVHMDDPGSKWTVDLCIQQADCWPLYVSRVRPWPEDWSDSRYDWQSRVKNDVANGFTAFELEEGQAIVFGGSSQWHYRERIEQKQKENFCHLIFFHFVPSGSQDLTDPTKWADLFDIPDLSEAVIRQDRSSPIGDLIRSSLERSRGVK